MIRRFLTICVTLAAVLPASAQSAADGETVLQQAIPHCYDATVNRSEFAGKLPRGFSAQQITLESDDPYCRFDAALVHLSDGRWYVGTPWPIAGFSGTPAEKLKTFVWERMGETFLPEAAGRDGAVERLIVRHVTEAGRVQLEGYVDPAGTLFMMGDIAANALEMEKKRDARLAPILAKAPTRGSAKAPITIIEFSDFQCPSCRNAHEFTSTILKKYGDKVKYTRVDLPLVSSHPWSFAAAVIGRAIHRQNPEAFWDWKDAVYSSQGDLTIFTIDQFGRNFAQDHGIDMAKYDADVVSEEIRGEILAGVGEAYTIRVSATPTFIVNGRFVSAGADGKSLDRYLAELADSSTAE